MSTRTKIIICIVSLATAFAVGRYTTSVQVKTVTKIVTVEKWIKEKHEKDQSHKETTKTEVVGKDGTKTTTVKTVVDTNVKKDSSSSDQISKTDEESKEILKGANPITISLLTGANPFNYRGFDVGVSFTKPVAGPVTVGAFAFRSGFIGASLGLTF